MIAAARPPSRGHVQSAVDNLLADALRAALPGARAAQEVRALTAAGPPTPSAAYGVPSDAGRSTVAGSRCRGQGAQAARRAHHRRNFADPMMGPYLVSEQLNVSNSICPPLPKATYGVSIIQHINCLR